MYPALTQVHHVRRGVSRPEEAHAACGHHSLQLRVQVPALSVRVSRWHAAQISCHWRRYYFIDLMGCCWYRCGCVGRPCVPHWTQQNLSFTFLCVFNSAKKPDKWLRWLVNNIISGLCWNWHFWHQNISVFVHQCTLAGLICLQRANQMIILWKNLDFNNIKQVFQLRLKMHKQTPYYTRFTDVLRLIL